ncbi:MAG: DUF4332 domain-containing protein [Methanomassiliicoccales archaeon]|nr:MAG: DUF4332 domain-containing protein [Methanomassiliicoccales archaeon]
MVVEHTYDLETELENIRNHQKHRGIPEKSDDKILVATWNIRQLGGGAARDVKDYQLIAEIIKPFDVIAIQEVKDNLAGLRSVMQYLPTHYKMVVTDRAGNYERLAYIYDSNVVKPTELAGELVLLDYERKEIALPGVEEEFRGFNRNPFQVSFKAGDFDFILVNIHTYYGSSTVGSPKYNQRLLETYALAKWASYRAKSRYVYDSDMILLGDFNMPKMSDSDPIYKQLMSFGLRLTKHSTEVGTNLAGTKDYDQIAFFPDHTDEEYKEMTGVFDIDKAMFHDLWASVVSGQLPQSDFMDYVESHISDHRVMWAAFGTGVGTSLPETTEPPVTEPTIPEPGTTPTKVTTINYMTIFTQNEKTIFAGLGIKTTDDLLQRVKTRILREQLRKDTGIKSRRINDLANYVDLMRITTVTEMFAVLLEAVGVDSVPELATRNPDNLFNNSITPYDITGHAIITKKPTLEQVQEWVAEAKTLPKVVEY